MRLTEKSHVVGSISLRRSLKTAIVVIDSGKHMANLKSVIEEDVVERGRAK